MHRTRMSHSQSAQRKGFTLIELLVVFAIIASLMSILMPALKRAREQGRRAACLSNCKQLVLAWNMYADENDDKIVNGATGFSDRTTNWGDHANELSWIDGFNPGPGNEKLVEGDIMRGALWPYIKSVKIFRCPTGRRGEALTYSIMFSMNAVNHPPTQGKPGVHIKRRNEIKPNTASRLVFIDEGWLTSDAFAVFFDQEQWWDDAPVRHGDGTTVSFADGHAEHWKWKGTDTIKRARDMENTHQGNWTPETEAGFRDLYRMQKGCWGRLEYTPSH